MVNGRSSSRKEITSFLVIHGIGEQNPFETLDAFARGLASSLEHAKRLSSVEHCLAKRKTPSASWTESFVRLHLKGPEEIVEVHEYYWAYMTEEQISLADILRWVKKAIRGAMHFAHENAKLKELVNETSGYSPELKASVNTLPSDVTPRRDPYWWRLLQIVWRLRFFYPVILFLSASFREISNVLPLPASITKKLAEMLAQRASLIMTQYIGDIAIYTTTDQKSRHYKLRQKILTESHNLFESLLAAGESQRLVLVGHSLGSVIAYDTLNRMNIEMNARGSERLKEDGQQLAAERIAGLITFGSPLDKIAFWFRDHVTSDQILRRQILHQLHSFKAKWTVLYEEVMVKQKGIKLSHEGIRPQLDHLPWVNYFSRLDPVSGHLDYYAIPEEDNVDLEFAPDSRYGTKWGAAHIAYWEDAGMFNDIVKRFLGGTSKTGKQQPLTVATEQRRRKPAR